MAVGRFQVMAMLQAARAYTLGLPLDSAYSWGLNRAIFYAAAKRGFKGTSGPHEVTRTTRGEGGRRGAASGRTEARRIYRLGDEIAYKHEMRGKLYFIIGEKAQTPEDFERQIRSRFLDKFKVAWDEALNYVQQFPQETLSSGTEFFQAVYKPKRDELAAKWTELSQVTIPVSQKRRRKQS